MRHITFAVLLLMVATNGWAMANMPSQSNLSVGTQAQDFTLSTASGQTKSLTETRAGKKAVIFFWATWCPHCHEEIGRLNYNIDTIRKKGIEVILVDLGETREEVAAYLKNKGFELDSFVDEDNTLQQAYQIVGVPTLYFLDEQGIIRHVGHEFPEHYEELFK